MDLSVHRDEAGIIFGEFVPDGRRPPLLTPAVFEILRALVDEAAADPPAGIIFTGPEGGDFTAGVDLEDMKEVGSSGEAFEV